MSNQIKVGVVGCGYWGPNLVRNFRSLPDCQLKMMCDISRERLKHLHALYPDVQGEENYDHMLNGVGVDAVVIATSVKMHFPMAKAALLAGKHVLIEKPMAASAGAMRGVGRSGHARRGWSFDGVGSYIPLFSRRSQNQRNH